MSPPNIIIRMSLNAIGTFAKIFDGSIDGAKAAGTALSGFSKETILATIASQGLTLAQAQEALSAAGLSDAEVQAALSAMGLAGANGVAAAATTTLGGAIKGLWAVLSNHPIILAIAAIAACVAIVDACTDSFDELVERASESRAAFEETQSEINSLNSELETTQDRIQELKAQGSLTLTEQTELDTLEAQNEKLERQIALKEKLAQLQGQEAADDAAAVLNKEQSYYEFDYTTGDSVKKTANTIDLATTHYNQLVEATREYEDALDACNEAEAEFGKKSAEYNQAKGLLEFAERSKSSLEELVATEADVIQTQLESIDGYAEYSDLQSRGEQFLDLYLDINSAANQAAAAQSKVDELLNRPSLSNAVEAMKELADAKNGLSDDDIEDIIAQFPELDKAARIAGVSIEDIINTINSMAGTINLDEVRRQLTEPNEHGLPS